MKTTISSHNPYDNNTNKQNQDSHFAQPNARLNPHIIATYGNPNITF